MKFKLTLITLIISSGIVHGADGGDRWSPIGIGSENIIDRDNLAGALEYLLKSRDSPEFAVGSSIVLSQFSSDSTVGNLGDTYHFRSIFNDSDSHETVKGHLGILFDEKTDNDMRSSALKKLLDYIPEE